MSLKGLPQPKGNKEDLKVLRTRKSRINTSLLREYGADLKLSKKKKNFSSLINSSF